MPHCQFQGTAPPLFSCRIFATGAILSDSLLDILAATPGMDAAVAARYATNKKPRDSQESRGFAVSILVCYRLLVQGGSYIYGATWAGTDEEPAN